MFTLLELLDNNMSRMQVFYSFLADCIFFGSLYWSHRIAKKAKEKEGKLSD